MKQNKLGKRTGSIWRVTMASIVALSFVTGPFTVEGQMADFCLYDVDGHPVTLSSLKGSESLLLVFWVTWSQDSVATVVDLKRRKSGYEASGVKIVAVNMDKNPHDLSRFVAENQLNFPVLKDPKGILEDQYGVYFLPTNILIDKENRIVYRGPNLPALA